MFLFTSYIITCAVIKCVAILGVGGTLKPNKAPEQNQLGVSPTVNTRVTQT
jgi:hypothetical protein